MTIVPFYGGLLALWFLLLSVRVVLGRVGPDGPSLGDGGKTSMLRRIRGHGNFSEYVPLVLLLMTWLEMSAQPRAELHALGAMLLAGRVLHGYALSFTPEFAFGRTAGIGLTFTCLAVAAAHCVYLGLHGL